MHALTCSVGMLQVLAKHATVHIASNAQASVDAHIRSLVQRFELEDPMFVLDLGCVMRLYNAWQLAMPRVHPFYAVKCNMDAAMIDLLAALGAGFDCASEAEVCHSPHSLELLVYARTYDCYSTAVVM